MVVEARSPSNANTDALDEDESRRSKPAPEPYDDFLQELRSLRDAVAKLSPDSARPGPSPLPASQHAHYDGDQTLASSARLGHGGGESAGQSISQGARGRDERYPRLGESGASSIGSGGAKSARTPGSSQCSVAPLREEAGLRARAEHGEPAGGVTRAAGGGGRGEAEEETPPSASSMAGGARDEAPDGVQAAAGDGELSSKPRGADGAHAPRGMPRDSPESSCPEAFCRERSRKPRWWRRRYLVPAGRCGPVSG